MGGLCAALTTPAHERLLHVLEVTEWEIKEGQGPSKEDCVVRRKETTAAAFPPVNLTTAFIPPQNLATKPRRLRDLPPEIQVDRSTRVIKRLVRAAKQAMSALEYYLPESEHGQARSALSKAVRYAEPRPRKRRV
jgi:hypothetical protein